LEFLIILKDYILKFLSYFVQLKSWLLGEGKLFAISTIYWTKKFVYKIYSKI